ncbi:MAG: sigma-70 family RNA polymerase sigma factor [Lachnospiraceae bacterium]|nr:sigma-70 family RNA polymerase sigma factor [Lachnospiraceae bacterium]
MMFQLLELIENEEDREFCRKLSEQFDSAMYHVAYGILKNSADAEDVVQESYIEIINNLEKVSRENCHKAWNYIVTIVRSRAINVYRKRGRECKIGQDNIENLIQELQGDGEIFELPDGSSMSELIGRMKYPYKEVLYLRYYNELSYDEIATVLNTTADNVRHISYRARKKLEDKLEKGNSL